jgi:hypothetical protein
LIEDPEAAHVVAEVQAGDAAGRDPTLVTVGTTGTGEDPAVIRMTSGNAAKTRTGAAGKRMSAKSTTTGLAGRIRLSW